MVLSVREVFRCLVPLLLRVTGGLSADAKECWFLHGAGEKCVDQSGTELPECPEPSTQRDMLDGLPYWGDFDGTDAMPHCSSMHYNHADTVYQRFDAPALRQSVCTDLCGGPGCVIVDKIIFTHSAANLYLAAALDFGDCYLGGSSDWFLVNAPALGSQAADFASSACSDTTIPGLERFVTSGIHYCTDRNGPHAGPPGATAMFESLQTRYLYHGPPGRNAAAQLKSGPLRAVMSEHASGSLCGHNPTGQKCPSGARHTSCAVDDAGLCALSKFSYGKPHRPLWCPIGPVPHCDTDAPCGVIDNDGMVGYDSCILPNDARGLPDKVYTENPESRWYRHNGNHEDGTCLNGDSSSDDQMPCNWYRHMAKLAVEGGAGESSPRISRYSCRQDGSKGCVRDAAGDFSDEASCVAQCDVCGNDDNSTSTASPCGAHGVCNVISSSTWAEAERHGGKPFACVCAKSYEGPLCDHPVVMSSPDQREPWAVLVVASLLLIAVAMGGLTVRRRWVQARGSSQHGRADQEEALLSTAAAVAPEVDRFSTWFLGKRSVLPSLSDSIGGSE